MADRRNPKQRRSKELVDAVLTAASSVVSKNGLQTATLDKISERAGVSVGSVYQYFSNKNSILGESVVQELDLNRQVMLDKILEWGHLPLREFVRNLVSFTALFFQTRLELERHIFAHSAELGKLDEHMVMRREVIAAVAQVFQRHSHELAFDDLDQVATIVVHSVMGAFTAPMLDKQLSFSIDDMKENVVQMVERFLLPTE
jgi:AcrR family transcriptional regulator